MKTSSGLEMLLVFLWIQAGFVPGSSRNLSKEDVLLLKDEENPKCFTRSGKDFTCFFQTADDRSYDLVYTYEGNPLKSCKTSVQRTEEGKFLHICSFPASDVMLYVEINLEVLERSDKTRIYSRTVSIEDHFLLDPPFNVTLNPNGHVGTLQVSWSTNFLKYWEENKEFRIRFSSRNLEQEIKEVNQDDELKLPTGEEVQVQVAVRCSSDMNNEDSGHWSSWSEPIRSFVPQSSDDISLLCFTSDLQKVTCQWNMSRYGSENEFKLSYKTRLSELVGWTEWTQCSVDGSFPDFCSFTGVESRKIRVQLKSTSTSRTFYSKEFTLKNSVKTSPPEGLRGELNKDQLCLEWKVPLPSLSDHLQYEVDYKTNGAAGWKMIKDLQTHACMEVPAGSQYSVKVKAKPTGSFYSGYWSDWSHELTGHAPNDTDLLLMLSIPASMLLTAVIIISLLSSHLSKLKQYFWPPVPNLEKVLQGYLMEINRRKWDPPITAKQCPEETASSLVEIMSEDDVSEPGKPTEESEELLSPEQVDENLRAEVFPDYVTLNKESNVLNPQRNVYDEILQTCSCSEGSGSGSCSEGSGSGSCSDFLNHSYLPLAEPADTFSRKVKAVRAPGNFYTNFPSS